MSQVNLAGLVSEILSCHSCVHLRSQAGLVTEILLKVKSYIVSRYMAAGQCFEKTRCFEIFKL